MNRVINPALQAIILMAGVGLLTACDRAPQETGGDIGQEAEAAAPAAIIAMTDDVIARVGDQEITFNEINTMLNSSAVVGVSIPALGTPQRDTVRITLLDKMVSANLLYLDALKQGVDQDPDYQQALEKFRNSILAAVYRDRYLAGDIEVSDEEVEAYYKESGNSVTELTDDARAAIAAVLRKQKLAETSAELSSSLREGVTVELNEQAMDPLQDAERADDVVLASIDGTAVTWGEARDLLGGKVASTNMDARRRAINSLVDQRILVRKARAAGLEQDPVYQTRYREYTKTRLINLHRANLASEFTPTDAELEAYYEANRDKIMTPEFRKVQFVVVKTEEEAQDLKQKLDAGEMTLYEAAKDYSIDPGAKQNLGEIGWVSRGRGWPELDDVIFALGPGEIGGPVKTPAGWNLLLVQDVREALLDDIKQQQTRRQTRRRYIHDKLNEYVINLRKTEFPVEVDEEKLVQLAQQEADMVKQLAERAAQPGSITEQRVQELQKYLTSPEAPQ
jgi:peptidyl-prolyl cis-trans isomerase C